MDSVIKFLADNNIFTIEKVRSFFVLTEGCDTYYSVPLTRDELRQLGEEIKRLANNET